MMATTHSKLAGRRLAMMSAMAISSGMDMGIYNPFNSGGVPPSEHAPTTKHKANKRKKRRRKIVQHSRRINRAR